MTHSFTNGIFYHIYPLGFCGALYPNNFASPPVSRLEEIDDRWIRHMKELEVGAVYLGPVFESAYHGYDTTDFFQIDRRLGDHQAFKALVHRLHAQGIKVVVDGVFHHVGRDFWAFRDVQTYGEASRYKDWFYLDFSQKSNYGDPFGYCCWEGYDELVKLNLHHSEVQDHLLRAVSFWMDEYDIDGIRLDVAYSIEPAFLRQLSCHCKAKKKDFWFVGEIIHGDYRTIANDAMLDSATNYECYKGLYSSHNDRNYFEIAYSLNRLFGEDGFYRHLSLYNFADNHDVDRVASILHNPAHLYPLYALLFTMPGIPSIYYGSEWGIEGEKSLHSDLSIRPQIHLNTMENSSKHRDLRYALMKLSHIRKNSRALQNGSYHQLLVQSEQLAYARKTSEECIIAAFNQSDSTSLIEISIPVQGHSLVDLLNPGDEFPIINHKVHLPLYPCWARILRVVSR